MADYSQDCNAAGDDSDAGLLLGGSPRPQRLPRKIFVAGPLAALSGLLLCALSLHTACSGFAMKTAANFDSISREDLSDNLQMKAMGSTWTLSLDAVVRDFRQDHPDFEQDTSKWNGFDSLKAITGLVQSKLGTDRKPVYNGGLSLTSKERFDQWYNDVPGVNTRVPLKLNLTQSAAGTLVADYSDFFPLNRRGFRDSINRKNYFFTLELHHSFIYHGEETFSFRGDDDMWVFINGSLVIDLGGLHVPLMDTVKLDDLGLNKDQPASLDIFFAERHTTQSNFRVETTIRLGEDVCALYHYMQLRSIAHNNLGGMGPDTGTEDLILRAGEYQPGREASRDVQLIVSVKPGSIYAPSDQGTNVLFGHYGRIGIKAGSEVTLILAVQDPKTGSSITQVDYTFFDLDQGVARESSEYIEVGGYILQTLMTNTEVKVSPGAVAGTTRFTASTAGSMLDNPIQDAFLTTQQKNRAVELRFENAAMVEVTMGCSAGTVDCDFLFKAKPSLKCSISPDGPAGPAGQPLPENPPTSTLTSTTTVAGSEPTTFCLIDVAGYTAICFGEKPWWMFWK